jgi:uncharacterized membrane protein YagU involved in acid resistance
MQKSTRQFQQFVDIKLTKLDKATTLLIINLGILTLIGYYLVTYSYASIALKQAAIGSILVIILAKFILSLITIHQKANQLRKETDLPIPTLKQAYAILIKETDVQTFERLKRTAKARK